MQKILCKKESQNLIYIVIFIIMVGKLITMLIAFSLFLPVGNVINFDAVKEERKELAILNLEENSVDTVFSTNTGFSIYTNYNGIEKRTPVLQSIFNGIDVDNNPETGENGIDLKVRVFALPLIQQTDIGWVLTISFALKVIRLGEEIKNGELEICFEGSISYGGVHTFKIGYYSAENEEIPREIREIITVAPYIFYPKAPEFYINVEPVFEGKDKNISIILEYENLGNHKISIDYFPATFSMIKIVPDFSLNKFNFSIEKYTEVEQTIRIRYEGVMNVSMTIEDIPQKMEFSIGFSQEEKRFEYMASDEFNASLIIEAFDFSYAMKIEYLPRHLICSFGDEGYIYIYINERKTTFIIADDIEEPFNYFMITNLSGEATIQWNIQRDGYIIINGFKGMEVEIKVEVGNIYFRAYSIVEAEHFETNWNLSIPGYVFIDTNNESLFFYSLNFTLDDLFGILIEAHSLKAEDFRVSWQASIPIFTKEGTIDFGSLEKFAIMLNGIWYDVFG